MEEKPRRVYIFDLWFTLVYGLTTDPIATFWQILTGKDDPCPDEFIRECLTVNISYPDAYAQAIARKFGFTATPAVLCQFRKVLRDEQSALGLYPDTLEVIDELRRRGHKTALASNLWPFAVRTVDKMLGLRHRFDHLACSFQVGHSKPSRELFDNVTGYLGVPAGQCTMVGDSLASDIRGSLAVGMNAVFIDRDSSHGQTSQDVPGGVSVVATLSQLL